MNQVMTYREWLAAMLAEDAEFKAELNAWTYEQKAEAYTSYLRGQGLDT